LRADVRARARPPGGFARPHHKRFGADRPAQRLLHKSTQSDNPSDGFAHDPPRISSRKRTGSIGHGRTAQSQRAAAELEPNFSYKTSCKPCSWPQAQNCHPKRSEGPTFLAELLHSGCRNGFSWRSCPIVVIGPCPGCTIVSLGRCISLLRNES